MRETLVAESIPNMNAFFMNKFKILKDILSQFNEREKSKEELLGINPSNDEEEKRKMIECLFEYKSKREKAKRRALYNILVNCIIEYQMRIEIKFVKEERKF